MADLHPIAICIRPTSVDVIQWVILCVQTDNTEMKFEWHYSFDRAAQPKNSEDISKQIFEKGRRIEQEFAEFFTGLELVNHLVKIWMLYVLILAIVEGDSQSDIYNKVKNIIHEQSGNYIWVPSNEPLWTVYHSYLSKSMCYVLPIILCLVLFSKLGWLLW